MNTDTITTSLEALSIVLDFWRRDIHDDWALYDKESPSGMRRRRIVARRIVRIRAAIRDLESQQPRPYPAWMGEPENAALAYAVDGR